MLCIVMCVIYYCATAAQGVAAEKRPCRLVIEVLTGNSALTIQAHCCCCERLCKLAMTMLKALPDAEKGSLPSRAAMMTTSWTIIWGSQRSAASAD